MAQDFKERYIASLEEQIGMWKSQNASQKEEIQKLTDKVTMLEMELAQFRRPLLGSTLHSMQSSLYSRDEESLQAAQALARHTEGGGDRASDRLSDRLLDRPTDRPNLSPGRKLPHLKATLENLLKDDS
ncbi:hypothetical protein HDU91_006234, partial [Kappamyces sp. JEL0680]